VLDVTLLVEVPQRMRQSAMSKQKAMSASSIVGEIFHVGLYKPTQGRITRQTTCGVFWVVFTMAAWRSYETMINNAQNLGYWSYIVPLTILLVGFWTTYRMVNYARFADFLIAVEAEMNKVSWPSRGELIRSSIVVIFVIFSLAIILFGFDLFWESVFRSFGILRSNK
jgi:preprotein translocase subunit SecE